MILPHETEPVIWSLAASLWPKAPKRFGSSRVKAQQDRIMLPLSRHYQNDVPQLDGVPKWIYRRMSLCTEIDFPSCLAVSSELNKKIASSSPSVCTVTSTEHQALRAFTLVFLRVEAIFPPSFTGVKTFVAPIKSFYVFVGFPFWISHTWLDRINKHIHSSCDFPWFPVISKWPK